MVVVQIILLVSLGGIAWQDFKIRAISWLFLPIVFIAILYIRYGIAQNIAFLKYTAINNLILVFIFMCTYIFFALKRGMNIKSFLNSQLGIGDVLLLSAITPYFNPMSFMVFMLISQFIILLGYLVFTSLTKEQRTIPLAGLISVFMLVIILFNMFFPNCEFLVYGYTSI